MSPWYGESRTRLRAPSSLTLGGIQDIENDLNKRINIWISQFIQRYDNYLPPQISLDTDALASFDILLGAIRQTPFELYLFIDEYDNFANELILGQKHHGEQRYH